MAPAADFKLQPHPSIPKAEGPVLVCILDGWGVNTEDEYNAIFSAETPITDALKANEKRYTTVKAHGTAVGLPSDADMGNSEVGHNALGSGQVVDQGARLVDIALETGKMFQGAGWKLISEAFPEHTVHFIGLLSDGGVHSRYDQLVLTIKGAVERGAKRVRVHILLDGRDVPDGSSVQFTQQLIEDLKFVGMMQYDGDLLLPKNFLVTPPEIRHTSGEYLVHNGINTFACSETQKFGHVTFFWNGNRSGYFDSKMETYLEIPSDKVPFNEAPDMKAIEITEAGKEALRSGKYQMVRINYANPDMVGHTGDLKASIRACTTVDKCLGELLEVLDEVNGRFLVTADHGNSDDMVQRDKKTKKPLMDPDTGKPLPLTSHTLAPVPVYIGGKGLPDNVVIRKDLPEAPGLANITATYVELLGLKAPEVYKPSLLTTE